jgi:hypothetical protein
VALRRKTNDNVVYIGDTVYDRSGKRYIVTSIKGALVHCRNKQGAVVSADLDQWGLYSDKPFDGHRASEGALRKQQEQSARRDAILKLRDYWENRE